MILLCPLYKLHTQTKFINSCLMKSVVFSFMMFFNWLIYLLNTINESLEKFKPATFQTDNSNEGRIFRYNNKHISNEKYD